MIPTPPEIVSNWEQGLERLRQGCTNLERGDRFHDVLRMQRYARSAAQRERESVAGKRERSGFQTKRTTRSRNFVATKPLQAEDGAGMRICQCLRLRKKWCR